MPRIITENMIEQAAIKLLVEANKYAIYPSRRRFLMVQAERIKSRLYCQTFCLKA
ncbi:MAG TPA: hypothetical protein VIK78_12605 [Ruminiclostridium sp.]